MTPTSKLRFVERDVFIFVATPKTIRVLQQWWVSPDQPNAGEWRDVPLEDECK